MPLPAAAHPAAAPGRLAGLHELMGAGALPLGAALLLAAGAVHARSGGVVALLTEPRAGFRPCAQGMAQLGLDPGALVWLPVADPRLRLRLMAECARAAALAAVVGEWRGRAPGWDLVSTRRLILSAERSGVLVLAALADQPAPSSAAHMRWRVAPAPSAGLEAGAPGAPTLELAVERRRAAPPLAPAPWRWDDEARRFAPHAALPGARLPAAPHRAAQEPRARRAG